ncbi:DoxX family protein [Flavobacteriaceae bacterium S0825]|uniref:DoxX family protein n=1 Tax=Gaetbulibacter sp. S0825 TaxID=2720084 RepID=UPI00142F961E|nr:DoxX family protein [Gaetbulibacter sp. S0825]MCK0108565.1 DoxX family protein [Flavobacteriaceae bacterium S0825]NIX64201.1 DoxX family protein [Gaetbulibacter sp. S0825]
MKYLNAFRDFITKIQPILLWLISLWFAYRLGYHGLQKLDPEGFWTNAFIKWGYPDWFRTLIGVFETLGALLLIIPKTRHLGGIILFVVMVGALITRITFGTSVDDALTIAFNAIIFLYLASSFKKSENK